MPHFRDAFCPTSASIDAVKSLLTENCSKRSASLRYYPGMKLFRLLAAALLAGVPLTGNAQTTGTLSPTDETAINTTLDAFGSTLTAMDFDTFATLFTEDADFTNIVGMHWHGKAQIVKAHRIVFTTRYRNVAQHTVDRTEALLAPDLVLVTATVKMDDYTLPDGKRMTNNLFRLTFVLRKRDAKWLIRSAQNTVIDSEAAKHDPGV